MRAVKQKFLEQGTFGLQETASPQSDAIFIDPMCWASGGCGSGKQRPAPPMYAPELGDRVCVSLLWLL